MLNIKQGKQFNTVEDAAEYYNISTVAIRNTITGKQKQVYGKTFCLKGE